MNTSQLKTLLSRHPDARPRFVLPGGDFLPDHVHITEVGHVAKRFIDCGGTVRQSETCVLQGWESDRDPAHRLTAGKLALILQLGAEVLPARDLEVEVEYEGCSISQYPLTGAEVSGADLVLSLSAKHTDCLAKTACGVECCAGDAACC